MAFGKKNRGKGSGGAGADECPVCRNQGGYWGRNNAGKLRPINCGGCGRPPDGGPAR